MDFVVTSLERRTDWQCWFALGRVTGRRNDARAMLQIGKPATRPRGLALRHLRLPTIGIRGQPDRSRNRAQPSYIGPRTESALDSADKSPANAVGR